MTRTFVCPDTHGCYPLLLGLLQQAGIVDKIGTRIDYEARTVHLGDLANCVARDRDADLRCLRRAASWFDVLIVGNHEYPYLGGSGFAGFMHFPEVERAITRLDWQPALAVGDTLLTHAGVNPAWALPDDAAEAEDVLRAAWQTNRTHPYFKQVGAARGGQAMYGGILWSDFDRERRDTAFRQVHGHTPHRNGPFKRDGALNLDVGVSNGWPERHIPPAKRTVGAWLNKDGEVESQVETWR